MKKKATKKKSSKKKKKIPKKTQKTTDPWKDYTAAMEMWKSAFDLWQQAGNEAYRKYNTALKTGMDPSKSHLDGMKQLTETWQKMWKK